MTGPVPPIEAGPEIKDGTSRRQRAEKILALPALSGGPQRVALAKDAKTHKPEMTRGRFPVRRNLDIRWSTSGTNEITRNPHAVSRDQTRILDYLQEHAPLTEIDNQAAAIPDLRSAYVMNK